SGFQQAAWSAMRGVPAGQTISYRELAGRSGTGSARAAGSACGRNAVALFVPCHRVVQSGGGLGGYYWGLDRKRWLLEHERALITLPLDGGGVGRAPVPGERGGAERHRGLTGKRRERCGAREVQRPTGQTDLGRQSERRVHGVERPPVRRCRETPLPLGRAVRLRPGQVDAPGEAVAEVQGVDEGARA